MVISGVAGPMTASDATTFRKKWKTPPRTLVFENNTVSPLKTDPDKGVERVGRALASDLHVQWKEYWSFLGRYINLSSTEGLEALEKYFNAMCSNASGKNEPEPPPVTPLIAVSSPVSPISDLCDNFKSLAITDDRRKVPPQCLQNSSTVFATRLALSLTRRSVQSCILEMNKYQDFLAGCSGDSRFSQEDLSTAHSQLAALVYSKIITHNGNSIVDFDTFFNDRSCSQESVERLECVLNFIKRKVNGTFTIASCNCRITPLQNANRLSKSLAQKCNRNLNFSNFNRHVDEDDDFFNLDSDEDEFATPPDSPALGHMSDDDDDDDEYVNASESPQIYIDGGHGPTKIDFDVYRTILDVLPQLDTERFPSIYYWASCMSKHAPSCS